MFQRRLTHELSTDKGQRKKKRQGNSQCKKAHLEEHFAERTSGDSLWLDRGQDIEMTVAWLVDQTVTGAECFAQEPALY